MLELMKEILNRFHHLTRDIFVYFIPGFFLLNYLIWFDWKYFNGIAIHHLFLIDGLKFSLLIVAYIIGHLIAGISYLIESFENLIKPKENDKEESDVKVEMEIYLANLALYNNYISRYSDLMYFRYHMKGALLIVFLFSTYSLLISTQRFDILIFGCSLILFIGISMLECKTESDLKIRRKVAKDLIIKS